MRALTGHDVEPTLIMREARAGDRYLLCSDGLSDPVSKDTILEALQIEDVNESADRLIELALRGGGPDNVTVVVADVVDFDYGQTQPILAGAVSGHDDDAVAPPNTAAGRASAIRARPSTAKRVVPQQEALVKTPHSRRRMFFAAALIALLVLAGLGVGRQIIRGNYYVTAHEGTVSIMRGISGSILGIGMQSPYLLGCLNDRGELSQISYGQSPDNLDCRLMQLQDLRPSERAQVAAGLPGGSLDEAIAQLRELARTSLLPPCPAPAPAPPPTPRAPAPTPPSAGKRAPAPASSPAPPPPPPTVTALPAPPPKPGTDCRAAA